jgi:hypothetical protein
MDRQWPTLPTGFSEAGSKQLKINTTLSGDLQNPIENNRNRVNIDTPSICIYDRLLSWLCTGTSKKVMELN